MAEKNMWGDLSGLEIVDTPTIYLKEQGELLQKATKYTLRGDVLRETSSGGRFRVKLDIIAPKINDYRYTLVTVRHPLEIYPLTITNEITNVGYDCADEEQFLEKLELILSSPDVRRAVSMLISQSRS